MSDKNKEGGDSGGSTGNTGTKGGSTGNSGTRSGDKK